jgi:hypothetical protein
MERSYVSIAGSGIDELFVTAGLSLPLGPSGALNTAFKVGTRGSTASGLQKDTFLQLTVGFTGNEVWFMSFTED